ncbi:thiol-disulfide oxidoreductase DCC family protein [Methylomonas sp. MgM2]
MSENPIVNSTHEGDTPRLTVYYDAACPKCRRDREVYEKLLGDAAGKEVCWFDITGQDEHLREQGIDPKQALAELHVRDADGRIVSELDAYILLMRRVPRLKPVAWLIGLPLIRPLLAKFYHWQVNRRLRKRGY